MLRNFLPHHMTVLKFLFLLHYLQLLFFKNPPRRPKKKGDMGEVFGQTGELEYY